MTTGFNYNDVIENERIPLKNEFYYSDSITTCGVVYAKLYNSEALSNNVTHVSDRLSVLNAGGEPSICHLAIGPVDHNVAIGYFGREVTDNENNSCVENEDNILNYNFPSLLENGDVLGSHRLSFVRNLVANKTCVAPIGIDSNGVTEVSHIRSLEHLPLTSKYRVGDNECHVIAAKLYYTHDIENVPVATLAGGNYDTKKYAVTLALDITRTDINGRRNSEGSYLGSPGNTIREVFGNPNIVVAALNKLTYDILGAPAYQEYYRSEQTGNITEYARREGISRPNFIGTLSYPVDCPRQYLADAELSFNETLHNEHLPLGVRMRMNDGRCFRNIMKLYNTTDYDQDVNSVSGTPTENERMIYPIFAMLNYSDISATYGDHNAVLQYWFFTPSYQTSPYYTQSATEISTISDYTYLSSYSTNFVSNFLYPVSCTGTEVLNDADIQDYINDRTISSSTHQLADNSNNEATNSVTPVLTGIGGLVLGGAIVGAGILAFKFIKGKIFGAKYRVEQKNAQADASSQEPIAVV